MTCIDIDECLVGSHHCSIHAACHNTVGSYKCTCETGFNGDGKNCEDINECEELENPCMADSHCVNFPGTRCNFKPVFRRPNSSCSLAQLKIYDNNSFLKR